ncbi:MAG: ATP-dependent DNA helicase RecG [Candidatus Neomarinimicrobiota bacterium]
MKFSDPITLLKNIGSKRVEVFNNHGIYTLYDLLYYFPRRHLDRTSVKKIKDLIKGESCTIIATVQTFGVKPIRKGKMYQVIVNDKSGILTLNWFNSIRIIKNLFKVGDKLAIHGKIDWFHGFSITHPEFDKLEKNDDPISTGEVIPLYPLTNEFKSVGIDQRIFRKIIKEALSYKLNIPEVYSSEVLKNNALFSLSEALQNIHYSSSNKKLNKAIKRLKFDEHFFLQLFMAIRKKSIKSLGTKSLNDIGPYFRTISESLNFELTGAQKKVIQEIHTDIKNNVPMNRLLQGDVGSGKTIVSILVSALALGNNTQVAIMAPTEILARQHFSSFKTEFDKVKISCALLVGNMKKKERLSILNGLALGKVGVLVGTHALIQEDVMFKSLNLVIIDEQHRFGVNQRAQLLNKGENPHFLAMTATPIPRTLSITYNGDMELSIIDELPKNRIPVITKVVKPDRLIKVFNFIKDQIKQNHQCMVIYPLVEESEKSDLAAAVQAYENFKTKIFKKVSIGLVHGKMKTEEKDLIMNSFSKNKISLLISTTVIEVGVDIPNATVMLIEHAERFGLTQLHQLRGRVGRGAEKSYCILVKRKATSNSNKRLDIMEETNDGFLISDEDLKLRGPGEFFGIKQSGFFKFKIADLVRDGPIIRTARNAAFDIVENDKNLKRKSNKLIRNKFLNEYSQYLDAISFS